MISILQITNRKQWLLSYTDLINYLTQRLIKRVKNNIIKRVKKDILLQFNLKRLKYDIKGYVMEARFWKNFVLYTFV